MKLIGMHNSVICKKTYKTIIILFYPVKRTLPVEHQNEQFGYKVYTWCANLAGGIFLQYLPELLMKWVQLPWNQNRCHIVLQMSIILRLIHQVNRKDIHNLC